MFDYDKYEEMHINFDLPEDTSMLYGILNKIKIRGVYFDSDENNFGDYSLTFDFYKAIDNGDKLTELILKILDEHLDNIKMIGENKYIMYYANIEKGIDTSGVLMLEYEGMQCVCIAAKDCKAPLSINIQGDEGYIHSESAANYFVEFEYGDNLGNKEKYTLNSKPFDERLYYELKEFCNILEDKNYKLMTNRLNHSIEVVGLLEKARNLANIKFE